MYFMLTSTHLRILLQLPTGTGKSLMFGLMSRYINKIQAKKTVVAVPNKVLAAIQQQKYSPCSSKDIGDVFLNNALINYCTYFDVLTGNIPIDTIVFIDEIDSLFFSDTPIVNRTRFLSAILLMNKYKIIGMTATFRGERGLNKIKALLEDTAVIKIGAVESERKL
jgi:superfamily II DNA or RNA helicase